jgi:hypothetical protein
MTGTFEKIKKGFEDTAEGIKDKAEDVVDPDTYKGSSNRDERGDYNEPGGKEPMNPEDIASHEATSVQRNQDSGIAEGQTGTDSAEAQEKYRKKGMTDANE